MNISSLKEENLTLLSCEVEELVRLASEQQDVGHEGDWVTRDCRIEWLRVQHTLDGMYRTALLLFPLH